MDIKDWIKTNDTACEDIVRRKYLQDIDGKQESIINFLNRVAGNNSEYFKLIESGDFVPAGRILSGRGMATKGYKITYSNCYVDKAPNDSIESIYSSCARIARTFSYGGGVGIDISNLAPKGAKVRNSAKESTGAVSFIETFSNVATTIGQNNRRGALMIAIKDTHPDLLEFITHKQDLNITLGANMSIKMSDAFFDAVKNDEMWKLSFTRKETKETIEKEYKARDIMHLIAKGNWDYAEPGVIFWDRVTNYNLFQNIKTLNLECVNPCAELPLPAYGACLLGSINLANFVKNKDFDLARFAVTVRYAIDYLNEVLYEGAELHPLKEQREAVYKYRQVGLGFMGLGDLFIRLGVRYGSAESISLIHLIGYTMAANAIYESSKLALKYDAFMGFDAEAVMNSDFYKTNVIENPVIDSEFKEEINESVKTYGLANSSLLTCAPTGTISTIFGISGGIEPLFALEFTRTTKSIYGKDVTYTVHPKCIADYMEKTATTLDQVKKLNYVVTSRDISVDDRLKVQAAWQKHIDASISSTINLPESATIEDVEELYIKAHDLGLKGVTVFRENCKRFPILVDTTKKTEEKVKVNNAPKITGILTRKDIEGPVEGRTYYKRVACGHIYITINRYKNKLMEVFMQSSKSGGCSASAEALGRSASTMLRANVDPEIIIDTYLGVKCSACSNMKGRGESIDGLSCSDVMARTIREELENLKNYEEKEVVNEGFPSRTKPEIAENIRKDFKNYTADQNIDAGYCPDCGRRLLRSEGCLVCTACGFSKC